MPKLQITVSYVLLCIESGTYLPYRSSGLMLHSQGKESTGTAPNSTLYTSQRLQFSGSAHSQKPFSDT